MRQSTTMTTSGSISSITTSSSRNRLCRSILSVLCVMQLLLVFSTNNTSFTALRAHAFVTVPTTTRTTTTTTRHRVPLSRLQVSELDKERQQQKLQQQKEQQQQKEEEELAAETQDFLTQQQTTTAATTTATAAAASIKRGSSIPRTLRIEGQEGIPSRASKIQLLDSSTYESYITKTWETDPSTQTGFDWEIEKLRRYAAGLRMRSDGSWVKQPSLFDFLVSPSRYYYQSSSGSLSSSRPPTGPPAAGLSDSCKVFGAQFLTSLGFGPALGMAAIPAAVIQKYQGSFFSFIKGVLGGDLQTLAGGPLFLLLAKYFEEYGPIFNLSL